MVRPSLIDSLLLVIFFGHEVTLLQKNKGQKKKLIVFFPPKSRYDQGVLSQMSQNLAPPPAEPKFGSGEPNLAHFEIKHPEHIYSQEYLTVQN